MVTMKDLLECVVYISDTKQEDGIKMKKFIFGVKKISIL